ncbi:hypothetical protein N7466_008963 [Penicillium verhagenii]|uniref:uncharacterized protein n=1 Tax=Penicillium verhagenii TaxID=1562060 RepID=UPI002544ED11|nr:uncharacterized protein N7466_008963 [Penicillium verhagenii]KAJ5924776.1 hypothetical protein N7466_008963 [Penicillium verhagenii]
MATTPPPPSPSALRVPTAPRHGAGYDAFEPYAPRYSARLASQRASRSKETTPPSCPNSPSKSKASPRKYRKTDETTISPPNSYSRSRDFDTHLSSRRGITSSLTSGLPPSHIDAFPTPAKTPLKKKVTGDLSSTSRALFPSASKMAHRMTPFPFSVDGLDASEDRSSIDIFTDSRDRIPRAPRTPGRRNPLRGKNMTKKFDDAEEDEEDDPNDLGLFAGREHLLPEPSEIQRVKPLRRKDIKPRMLWASESDLPVLQEANPKPTAETATEDEATDDEEATYADHKQRPVTSLPHELPPSPKGIRKLRSQSRRHVDNYESPCESLSSGSNTHRTAFHGWLRKKKSSEEQAPAVPATKREAEEDVSHPGAKRTRATRKAHSA